MRIVALLSYLLILGLCAFAWVQEARIASKLIGNPKAEHAKASVDEIASLDRAKDLLRRSIDAQTSLEGGARRIVRAHQKLIVVVVLLGVPGLLYAIRKERA